MLIRIIKDWDYPDLMRQTPKGLGVWGDFTFTLDPVRECDYVIVLNRIPEPVTVICPPENIWAIMQEPPVREYKWLEKGYENFHKVITSNGSLRGAKFIFDSLALPWHIDKSYDELIADTDIGQYKQDRLSWITSNAKKRLGHKQRMSFLKCIRGKLDFDLFGRGFNPVKDKWDGINPYKYSLAIENSNSEFYWTEKISDCFLSRTMPIYYGCTNIDSFFPKDSMIKVDINKPAEAVQIINNAIKTNAWEKNFAAIEQARQSVLEKYQFFPFISSLIIQQPKYTQKQENELTALPYSYPGSAIEKLKRPLTIMKGLRSGR